MEFLEIWQQRKLLLKTLKVTQHKSAVLRWSLSRHVVGEYSSAMQEFSSKARTYNDKSQYQNHRECQPACMRRDENHVCLIVDHIYSNMTNPFDVTVHPQLFVKISNGLTASCEVQHSLLNIVPTDGEKSMYSTIKRSGLLTFDELDKKAKVKTPTGKVVLVHVSPEMIFRRALGVASMIGDVNMVNILSHPVGSVPLSMFHVNA